MPLDDAYSFDFGFTKPTDKELINATKSATDVIELKLTEDEKKILSLIRKNPQITQKNLHKATGISLGTIKRILPRLQKRGCLSDMEIDVLVIGRYRTDYIQWNVRFRKMVISVFAEPIA